MNPLYLTLQFNTLDSRDTEMQYQQGKLCRGGWPKIEGKLVAWVYNDANLSKDPRPLVPGSVFI